MPPIPIRCPFCNGMYYYTGGEMIHHCERVHTYPRGKKVVFSWTVKEWEREKEGKKDEE